MSQKEQIKEYLLKGRSLTPLDALSKFGCFRLSGRILELREAGYNIETEMVELENGKRVGQYKLKEDKEN